MQRIINRLSIDGLFVIIILFVSIALLMQMATTRTTIVTPKLAFATFATDTSCNTDAARTNTTLQKKCDSEMSFLYEICQAPNANTLLSNNINTITSGA